MTSHVGEPSRIPRFRGKRMHCRPATGEGNDRCEARQFLVHSLLRSQALRKGLLCCPSLAAINDGEEIFVAQYGGQAQKYLLRRGTTARIGEGRPCSATQEPTNFDATVGRDLIDGNCMSRRRAMTNPWGAAVSPLRPRRHSG